MSRVTRLLVVGLISASLAVFANGSATLGAVRRVALGAAMTDSRNINTFKSFTASLPNWAPKPAIWTLWSEWGGPDSAFPSAFVQQLHAESPNTVPMINWEPLDPANQTDCTNWSLDATLSGRYDSYIRTWAQAAKDYGSRVIVRLAHEMNGYWYIWGVGRCTNTPAKFQQFWQRVWNIFKGPGGVGATNVKFLWSVSGKKNIPQVYPGNAYVDYMGLSAFNWARSGATSWRTMVQSFAPTMKILLGVSTKPIIGAEVGSAYKPLCGTCDKPAWIRNGYPAVRSKWARVVAIVYFNIDMRFEGHPDWRLTTPPAALDAYRGVVADWHFWGTIP